MSKIFLGFLFGFFSVSFFWARGRRKKSSHFSHVKQIVFSLSLFYFFCAGASASRESLPALRRTRDLVRMKVSEKVFEKVFFSLFEEFEKQKTHIFQPLSVWFHPTLGSKTKNRITLSSREGKNTTASAALSRKNLSERAHFRYFSPTFFLFFLLSLSLSIEKPGRNYKLVSLLIDRAGQRLSRALQKGKNGFFPGRARAWGGRCFRGRGFCFLEKGGEGRAHKGGGRREKQSARHKTNKTTTLWLQEDFVW